MNAVLASYGDDIHWTPEMKEEAQKIGKACSLTQG